MNKYVMLLLFFLSTLSFCKLGVAEMTEDAANSSNTAQKPICGDYIPGGKKSKHGENSNNHTKGPYSSNQFILNYFPIDKALCADYQGLDQAPLKQAGEEKLENKLNISLSKEELGLTLEGIDPVIFKWLSIGFGVAILGIFAAFIYYAFIKKNKDFNYLLYILFAIFVIFAVICVFYYKHILEVSNNNAIKIEGFNRLLKFEIVFHFG